jgi:hypothetical protein
LLRDAATTLDEPIATRAVAALVLMEVEPGLVHASAARAAATVEAIAGVLRTAGESLSNAADTRDAEPEQHETASHEITRPEHVAVRDDVRAEHEHDLSDEVGVDAADARGDGVPPRSRSAAGAEDDHASQPERAGADPGDTSASGSHPVDAQRRRAWTQAGGLLFVLNVLDDLELGAALADDETLAERPLRWSLHRLALQLAPVGAEDPAALAFAGLAPDDDPPSLGETPPTDAELERIVDYADRVVADLRDRLERPDDPPLALLDAVCRRRAEIVADPGWIEARFSAEDADAELRRAALDLDPGWLPWLGAVVVFAYD